MDTWYVAAGVGCARTVASPNRPRVTKAKDERACDYVT